MTATRALGLVLALLGALVAGPAAARTTSSDPGSVTFRDARGDVLRGHDIRKVRVRNEQDAVTVKVWHRDLRRTHQYSFKLYLDTDPATPTPEVKVYGAFPNADYLACTTTSWSTGAIRGCDPEDAATQCRVDMHVRWLRDVTRFELRRTRTCLTSGSPVRVNVGITQYWPKETRWDYAPDVRVWSRTVPLAGG